MCVIWNTDVGRAVKFGKRYFLHEIAPFNVCSSSHSYGSVVVNIDRTRQFQPTGFLNSRWYGPGDNLFSEAPRLQD